MGIKNDDSLSLSIYIDIDILDYSFRDFFPL